MFTPFDDSRVLVAGGGGAARVEDQPAAAPGHGLPLAAIVVQNIKEVNVVGTLNLGCDLDLRRLSARLPNAEYMKNKKGIISCKLNWKRTMGLTAFMFTTGKVNFMGAASDSCAHRAADEIARLVRAIGFPEAQVSDFVISNRVGTLKLPFSLDLELLLDALNKGKTGSYTAGLDNVDGHLGYLKFDPLKFNGLEQKVFVDKWVTVTIYQSGSLVITGAQELHQFSRCVERLYPFLKSSCRLARNS